MPKRNKKPFCQLECVFDHPRITSICERADLLVDLLPAYDDLSPIFEKLNEIDHELNMIVAERAPQYISQDDAQRFIEAWNKRSRTERLNALVSIHHKKLIPVQRGDKT
jgi:hypothetical protein